MKIAGMDGFYNEYITVRKSNLNKDEFGTLAIFFPALSVIFSDGKIDEEEQIYVKYLAKFMSNTYKDEVENFEEKQESIQIKFYSELNYLTQKDNFKYWTPKFLTAVGNYVLQHPEVKEDIIDILHLFAQASEGESDEELREINHLKEKLHL